MHSNNDRSLTEALRIQLVNVARRTIKVGLGKDHIVIHLADYPEQLRERRASFVTLYRNGKLRGCIGTLEPNRSLVEDIAHNAYQAAFSDPRFMPLTAAEFDSVDIHLSVLSLLQPLVFNSEPELLMQLRPRIDGLVLIEGRLRSTFLPAVWEQLPEPQLFFSELKRKAGLPTDYWSDTVTVQRYTVETIP